MSLMQLSLLVLVLLSLSFCLFVLLSFFESIIWKGNALDESNSQDCSL